MAKDKALPLLNSERKELLQKIKDAENKADTIYAAALRKVNSTITTCKILTEAQKIELLALIWSKE